MLLPLGDSHEGSEPGWVAGGRHRLFVRNEWFVCFGYTDALAGGELLVTETTPPGLGARFELRLPMAEPAPAPFLAYAASRR